jgi:hypothetical protein
MVLLGEVCVELVVAERVMEFLAWEASMIDPAFEPGTMDPSMEIGSCLDLAVGAGTAESASSSRSDILALSPPEIRRVLGSALAVPPVGLPLTGTPS